MAGEMFIERKFGFCEISWDIRDFCLAAVNRDWTFNSPDFYIRGFKLTKWRMALKRNHTGENTYHVTLILKRLACDEYYEKVRTEFKVKCFNAKRDLPTKTCNFGVDSESSLPICFVMDNQNGGYCDVFRTQCDIMVIFQNVRANLQPISGGWIKMLSEEFDRLFECTDMSDFSLRTWKNELKLHKVVLHYRIKDPEFRDSILNKNALRRHAYPDVRNFFRFLYTGSLECVAANPTISVYKMALASDTQPIIKYYEPDRLKLFTVVYAEKSVWGLSILRNFFTWSKESLVTPEITEEFKLSWTIPNFLNRYEDFLVSPVMTNGNMNLIWQCVVYPNPYGRTGHDTEICLEVKSGGVSAICFTISFDSTGCPSYYKHMEIKAQRVYEKIVSCDDIKRYLKDGSLTIFCKLRYLTGDIDKESKSIGTEIVKSNQLTEESIYKEFRNDMESVINDRWYSKLSGFMKRQVCRITHEIGTMKFL